MIGSPLLLQAQITPPLVGGMMGLANSTLLENPFNTPMWVDEIRFFNDFSGGVSLWARLKVELRIQNTPLTNGFVPIPLLGKVLSDAGNLGGAFLNLSHNCATWKLPKPLFLPARESIRVAIYFETFSGATGYTPSGPIVIKYACRPLPAGTPTPKILQIPWVTYFKPIDLATGSDRTDQSSPSDIFNPFDQDLHVQRFVGRLMQIGNFAEVENNDMGLASEFVSLPTGPSQGSLLYGTLVSAQDSFNNILIRDRTPFAHVFDILDRSWTVNCILPPKGFYLFTIDRLWAAYNDTAHSGTVGISMVGWREVSYYS